MFTFLPPAIIALLLAPSAYSFRPEDRECNTNLCLQSLKWCDYGSDNQNNCYYPDNVYSQADYAGSFPGLVWNHEYEIKWTKRDQETPVTIRWGFVREDGQGRPKLGADWEYNVTDGSTSYIFKPSSAMFPNNLAPNMSYAEAQGLVMQQSILSIHQFSDPNNVNSSETAQDFSHSFVVIDGWDVAYIQYAREEVRREWSRKFRLALAVGIPLTFCVTWFLAVTYAWWWSKRRVARDGEKGLTARTWWWGF